MAATLSKLQHDDAVRFLALRLVSKGYDVRARLEGWFEAPDFVNGYRPDIVARKGEEWIVVEIKKGEVDWPKISALKRQFEHESQHFQLLIISPEQVSTNTLPALAF